VILLQLCLDKFSIGLRSGKFPGQSITDMLFCLRKGHDLPTRVAGHPIVEEVLRLVVLHPDEELVLRHGDVAGVVHCHLEWKEVERVLIPLSYCSLNLGSYSLFPLNFNPFQSVLYSSRTVKCKATVFFFTSISLCYVHKKIFFSLFFCENFFEKNNNFLT
jgi:hypothetical protein